MPDKLIDLPNLPLRYHILKEFHKLIIAALAFVAAGAWNNAMVAIFTHFWGNTNDEYNALFIYALIITIVALVAIIFVGISTQKILKFDLL